MAETDPTKDEATAKGVAAVIALIVAIAVAIPTLLAVLAWFIGDRWARRTEWILVTVAGLAATAVVGVAGIHDYGRWLAVLATGNGSRLAVPAVTLAAWTLLLAGILGVVSHTKYGRALADAVRKRIRPDELGDREQYIPDDVARAKVDKAVDKIVAVPGAITGHDHTLAAAAGDDASFVVGVDQRGQPVRLSGNEMKTHMMLLGSTGSGKTVTITTLLGGFLDMGWSGVVIDLKEDTAPGGLADFCRTYAARHALPYQEVALSSGGSPNWFNPLLGLDPDAARDAILAMQSFEAAHYEALGKKVLGQLVTLMFDATKVDPQRFPYPDIFRIGQILGRPSIKDATREMRAEVIKALPYRTTADFESLATPDKDIESARPGLSARLTQIYNTDAGRNVLRPQHPGHRPIDVTAPGVCYIGLSSTNLPDLSKAVASATLLRMAAEAGRRTSLKRNGGALTPIMLVIDEANEVDQTKLQNILSRARSADIRTLVSTQGPKDFPDDKDTPGFSALLQNTTTQIIMSQTDPESAEICANVIGQQEYDVVTRSIREGELGDGGSLTRRTDYRVHPDQLRQLEIGEGVMNVMRPHRRLQWVKFVMRRPDQ